MERRFTFGVYLSESDLSKSRETSSRLDNGTLMPTIAIEILREFTPDEFSGRIYLPVSGQWIMARPQVVTDYAWSQEFREGKRGCLVLKGSPALWTIVQLRGEHDPEKEREYMAITLRQYMRELDRWEGNIHYKDFTPDSVKRWPDRDASTIAEAWIYSDDRHHNLGIVVLVDEFDVARGVVTLERAIKEGATLRDRLVQQYRDEARSLKANRVLRHSWNGQRVE